MVYLFETTQHIKWWHPVDHVEHRGWDANWKRGESFYGASIHAVESLAEIPPIPARLKFHHPASVFGEMAVDKAMADGSVSAIIAARIGFGEKLNWIVRATRWTDKCYMLSGIRLLGVYCVAGLFWV